jgi:hypothetical protein
MTMQRATNVAVATTSAEPLRGILEIGSAGGITKFEISEDLAHQLCSDLERFLTQVPRRVRAARFG